VTNPTLQAYNRGTPRSRSPLPRGAPHLRALHHRHRSRDSRLPRAPLPHDLQGVLQWGQGLQQVG